LFSPRDEILQVAAAKVLWAVVSRQLGFVSEFLLQEAIEQCSKPLLLDDCRRLYYPVFVGD